MEVWSVGCVGMGIGGSISDIILISNLGQK
jgi:hypothetical protein